MTSSMLRAGCSTTPWVDVSMLCCGRTVVSRCWHSLRVPCTASTGEQSWRMTWRWMKPLGRKSSWRELSWPNIYRNTFVFLILFLRKVYFWHRNYTHFISGQGSGQTIAYWYTLTGVRLLLALVQHTVHEWHFTLFANLLHTYCFTNHDILVFGLHWLTSDEW